MWQLFQFPLCPFSRKVRLALTEKGVPFELVRENPWERRDEYVDLNPTGRTPIMRHTERDVTLIDSQAICEYFEESGEGPNLIAGTAEGRAETRRLIAWFDQQMYGEVVGPLLRERLIKRLLDRQPPDGRALRDAMQAANFHLDYIDYLLDHRPWISGATMSLADITAAAHISVADYLGGIDWSGHEQTRGWYAGFKSRPSFRTLLSERMEIVLPPKHYEQLDF